MITLDIIDDLWEVAYDIWLDVLKESGMENAYAFMDDKLFGTTFQLINAKNTAGKWNYSTKVMSISKFVIEYFSKEEIMNTILHEMLHGLTPYEGHKGLWLEYANLFNKSAFAKIYGEIKRCYTPNSELKEAKNVHMLRCGNCDVVYGRATKSKKVKQWINAQSNWGYVCKCKCGGRLCYEGK